MKKSVSLVAVFLISSVIGLYGKKINSMISEKPQTKTVQFSIYASGDYSARLYKKSKAKVVLSVYKYTDDGREMVWQSNIGEKDIKSFPSKNENPIFTEISVFNVYESKETLVASYQVIYDTKGSKLSYEDGIVLSKGANSDKVSISI